MSSSIGKIMPDKIPIFRLSPNAPDTIPTNVGPPEQPISPPKDGNFGRYYFSSAAAHGNYSL